MLEARRPIMVSLVGEQPIPNLLAARHFCSSEVVLAFTEKVKSTAERLQRLLKPNCEVHCLKVFEFHLERTQSALTEFITRGGWEPSEVVFNLTGGTKMMALAAYRLAAEWKCPFIYVESDENLIYRYEFTSGGLLESLSSDPISPGLITLEEYLRAHIGNYTLKGRFGDSFEEAVFNALEPHVNKTLPGVQVLGQIDVDLAFRLGNQVGCAQLKTARGDLGVEVLGQLSLHAHQELLGTYTERFLIVSAGGNVHHNLRVLARAFDAKLIELPSFQRDGCLSSNDKERLIREVVGAFQR